MDSAGEWLPTERPRLMRLCAQLTGDLDAAEDLAQECLFEALRHVHRLHNQDRRAQWLSAIARNVCLRWARRRSHDLAHLAQPSDEGEVSGVRLEDWGAADVDLELVLERHELAQLLDRALALLPPQTRTMLIAHYVDEMPQAEIAARLGVSESLVKARLHRGKRALHRLLTTDFLRDAASYGLINTDQWQETRIWCPYCGQRHLKGRLTTCMFVLSCPHCTAMQGRGSTVVQSKTDHPLFTEAARGVKGYKPVLSRLMGWADGYYRRGIAERRVPCLDCGRMAPLQPGLPPQAPPLRRPEPAVHVRCDSCGSGTGEVLSALALYLWEGRRFWRQHPRIRAVPGREVEVEGRAALVTSFESVTGQGRLDVVSARDTLELLSVHEAPHAVIVSQSPC